MAIDVYGILYMTKKWSVPENVDNNVKQPLDEETTCPKRDLDKDSDAIHQNERNLDEPEYERAFENGCLSELRGTTFLEPLSSWSLAGISNESVSSAVMCYESSTYLGVYEHLHDLNTPTELITCSKITS